MSLIPLPRYALRHAARRAWKFARIKTWWKWIGLPSKDAPDPMMDLFVEVYCKGYNRGKAVGEQLDAKRHAQAALAETRANEQRRNEHV